MRILLIEDEIEMARYLLNGLQEAGYEVSHALDAQAGLQLATSQHWDAMIIDRMLPDDREGLDIIKEIRQSGEKCPVLVLSALSSLDERIRGLREGGDDYLTKPFALTELLARIEALIRRSSSEDGARVLKVADLVLDLRTHKAKRAEQAIILQPREFRLLEYLVRHQGQVVTRTMLLEAVWDFHFDPGTNVIDVQISRLRNKIDKGHEMPLLHTVRGLGYVFGLRE